MNYIKNGLNEVEHKVSDGTTSQQLYRWLNDSGYNKREFKYINVVDENGNLVIEILDKLNVIYNTSVRSINKMEDNDKLLNLKNAKKSKEIGLNLYYMIVKLMDSYYDNNRDEFNNYCRLAELYKCLYNYMDMINKTRGKNK